MHVQYAVFGIGDLAETARSLVERYGWWGVFVAMALQGATMPIANEITMPLAGWLLVESAGKSRWYIGYAGLVGATGWVVGALVAYTVMAVGGQAILLRFRRRFPAVERALAQSDRWLARYGAWAAFFTRLLPVSRTISTLPMGAARVPVVPFALATFAGAFIWSTFLAALGYAAGSQWSRIKEQLGQWTIPTVIVVVILLALIYLVVHVRRHPKEDATL